MSKHEIAEAVMGLPENERLELARHIVANIEIEREISDKVRRSVPGIEDILTGNMIGLSEEEFRNALK